MIDVRELQRGLAAIGFDPGKIDGQRGPKTIEATKAFQRKYGLVPDGIPGLMTITALLEALTPPEPKRPEPDKSAIEVSKVPAISKTGRAVLKEGFGRNLLLQTTARAIDEIIVHCAATPEGKTFTVADIRAWHKQRGWSDIGYHYVVYLDGSIHEGRPIGQQGAHCGDKGKNKRTIGIVYIGGVTADGKRPKDTRTAEQKAALLWLVKELSSIHPVKKISGHNDYTNKKACPSFKVGKDSLAAIPGFKAGVRVS